MLDYRNDDFYIGEEDYKEKMTTLVEPFIDTVEDGYFLTDDHTKIHYYYKVNPEEKGAIVISHGFCEFFGKFYETAYYFYQAGYSVFFIQHRGHELSGRVVEDKDMVYVKSYDEYVSDLHQFITEVVKVKSATGKIFLWSHSMGGLIASLYIEEHPDVITAAALCSPMHRINYGVPEWVASTIVNIAMLLGMDKKYGPGQTGYHGQYDPEHSSEMSYARYDYYANMRATREECTMYGGSYAWVKAGIKATKKCLKNASSINTPFLLCEGEKDTMVDNTGHDDFLKAAGSDNRIIYEGSKHEMYAATPEIRKKFFIDVLDYYGKF